MSAPATAQPDSALVPAESPKKGKKEKKPPKPRQPRKPWGIGPWLLLSALFTGAAAVAVLFYPIPGLTTKPTEPPPASTAPAQTPVGGATAAAKEQELAQKEADLQAREAALQQKELEVAGLLKDLGASEAENASLRRAANMYGAMSPYKAGPLVAAMPIPEAAQVLRLLTDDQAGAILAAMKAESAAAIMNELTRPPVSNPAGG